MAEFFLPTDNSQITQIFESQRERRGEEALGKFQEKALNSVFSLEEKSALAQPLQTQKYQTLDGTRNGTIISSADGDTFDVRLDDGTVIKTRMASNDGTFLDAIETGHYGSSPMEAVDNSTYKRQVQPQLVSQLLGKPIYELTDDDYNLVGGQAQSRTLNALRGDGKGDLGGFQQGEQIPVALNIVGKDKYGRYLTEFINPNTREAVSSNLANDPTFNASWSITQLAKESPNSTMSARQRISDDYKARLKNEGDYDGRIGEFFDVMQSAGYQSAIRFMKALDSGTTTLLNALSDKNYQNLISSAWTPDKIQELTDRWAGVRGKTREEFNLGMQNASTHWRNGNHATAIKEWVYNLDRVIAELMPSMALSVAGIAATGGTGLAARLGGGALAKLGSAAIGQSLAAGDMTLSTMEQYKANNGGKSMSAGDIAKVFTINVLSQIPGALLTGLQWQKALPGPVGKLFSTGAKYQAKALPSKGALILGEAGEEFSQETLQTSVDTYFSQNQENKQDFLDIVKTEGIEGGIVGSLAGGAMATAGQYNPVTIGLNYNTQRKFESDQKVRDAIQKDRDTKTYTNEPLNEKSTKRVIDSITTLGTTKKDLKVVDTLLKDTSISKEATNQLQKKRTEILVAQAKEGTLSKDVDRDELLVDIVFHSDPLGQKDTKGKVTAETTQERIKSAEEQAKAVFPELSEAQIKTKVKKTLEQVSQDVITGTKDFIGYETHRANIENAKADIAKLKPNSSPEARTKLDRSLRARVNAAIDFRTKQNAKLNDIIDIANGVANGDFSERKLRSSNFIVKGENLHKDSYGSKIGTHGIVASLVNTIQNLDSIIGEFNPDNKEQLLDFSNTQKLLDQYKQALGRIAQKTEAEVLNPPKSTVSKVVAKVTGKTNTPPLREAQTEITDVQKPNVLRLLKSISRTYAKGERKTLSSLRALHTTEAWQAFRDKYAKESKPDKDILDTIDNLILAKKVETEAAQSQKDTTTPLVEKATKGKEVYTEASVDETKTIDEANQKLKAVQQLSKDVVQASEADPNNSTLKELRDYYANYWNKLKAKRTELIAKLVEDETKDNTEEETSPNIDGDEKPSQSSSASSEQKRIGHTPTGVEEQANSVARKLFKTLDKYIRRIEKVRPLVSDFLNADKVDQLRDLSVQHELLLNEWEVKLSEREYLEELLNNGIKRNPDTEKALSKRAQEYQDKIDAINMDITRFDEELGEARVQGNTEQISKIESEVKKLKAKRKKANTQVKRNQTRATNIYKEVQAIRDEIDSIDNFFRDEIAPIENQIKDVLKSLDNATTRELFAPIKDERMAKLFPALSEDFQVKQSGADSILGSVRVDTSNEVIKGIIAKLAETIAFRENFTGPDVVEWFSKIVEIDTQRGKIRSKKTRYEVSPQFILMVRPVSSSDSTSKFEINPEVAIAMDLGLREYLTNNSLGDIFTPFDEVELTKRFGGEEIANIYDLRNFNQKFGIPGSTMATQIGENILRNLGIEARKDAAKDAWAEMAAGLGEQAIVYGERQGWLTMQTISNSEYLNAKGEATSESNPDRIVNVLKHQTPMVRLSSDEKITVPTEDGKEKEISKVLDDIKKEFEASLDGFLLDTVHENKPSPTPYHLDADMEIRNTEGIGRAPSFVKMIMEKLYKTKFAINKPLVNWLRQPGVREIVEHYLGMTTNEDITDALYDTQEGLKGQNLSIKNQIDYLLELDQWNAPYYYFKWFMARNNRLHIQSNHADPQGGKALQRFLLTPRNSQSMFYKDSTRADYEQQMKELYYTLAQAFDNTSIDKDNNQFGKLVLEIDSAKLWKALTDKTLVGGRITKRGKFYTSKEWVALEKKAEEQKKKVPSAFKLKIENFGQVLVALQTIEQYQNTPEGGSFRTFLTVENDATTSGVANTFLQHPSAQIVKNLLSKVGVISEGNNLPFTEIHNLKKQTFKGEQFLDIYETTASVIELPSAIAGLKLNKVQQRAINRIGSASAEKLYSQLLPVLPRMKDGKVTGDLRALVKPGTMTYFYGQGGTKLAAALGNDISESLMVEFLKIMKGTSSLDAKAQAEYKTLFSTLAKAIPENKNGLEGLVTLLQTTPSMFIKLRYIEDGVVKTPSLKFMLASVIESTYGNEVFQALDRTFGQTIIGEVNGRKHTLNELNSAKSLMVNTEFDIFIDEFNAEVARVKREKADKGEKYTAQDEIDIVMGNPEKGIQGLFDVMPTMKLLYNEQNEQGLIFLNTERAFDINSNGLDRTKAAYVNKYRDFTTTNVSANIRRFIDIRASGGVLSTQALDGTIMFSILEKYADQILGIHDAIQGSGLNSATRIREMNRLIALINRDYDVFDILYTHYNNVLSAAIDRQVKRGLTKQQAQAKILGAEAHKDKLRVWTKFFFNGKGKNKTPLTRQQLLGRVTTLNNINSANRRAFYESDTKRTFANVDSVSGLYEYNRYDTLSDYTYTKYLEENSTEVEKTLGADPNGYTSTATIEYFRDKGAQNEEVRVKIAEAIRKLDPRQVSDEYFHHVVKTIIKRVNPKALKDLVVTAVANDYTTGILGLNSELGILGIKSDHSVVEVAIDDLSSIDVVSGLSPKSIMSAVEVYAHEIIHAGVRLPIQKHKLLGFTNEVQQLMDLQRKASKVVTWEAFMPSKGSYDPALQADYEANAHRIWNYIFDNSNDLEGVHEFVAYGLTNPAMMALLQSNYINTSSGIDKVKFLDRLISLAIALLDVFRGKGKITTVFSTAKKVVKGDLNLRNQRGIYEELVLLNDKLNKINQRATNKLQQTVLNKLQDIFGFLGDLIIRGNHRWSPATESWLNFVDDKLGLEYTKTMSNIHGSKLAPLKLLAWVFGLMFSKSRQQALGTMLSQAFGMSQQGVVASILRDIQESGWETSLLEDLARYTRMTEQASKALEARVVLNLIEGFGRQLTDDEQQSLTKVFLYTDFSNLAQIADGKVVNIDELIELLKQPYKINDRIKSIEANLRKLIPSDEQFKWYMNSSKMLSNMMTTGKGTLAVALNANNIAKGAYSGKTYNVSPNIVSQIDNLVSLYALQQTNQENKNLVSTLTKGGLENMLLVQNEFIQESRQQRAVNPIHEVKGYTKTLVDNTVDMKVASLADQFDLEQLNYKLVKSLAGNEFTDRNGLGIFIRSVSPIQSRQGAAFILSGNHAMGMSLTDSAYALQAELDAATGLVSTKDDVRQLRQTMFDKAMAESQSLINIMKTKNLSFDQINRLTKRYGGYSPIASPDGGIHDFRLTMSIEDKMKYLGLRENAFEILGKMFASNNTKQDARSKNLAIIEFLENDAITNMDPNTRLSRDNKDYVLLDENSPNEFIRDAFKAFPRELKVRIADANTHGDGFWVRNEWLSQLFGSPSVSIIDNKTVKKWTNAHMKKWIVLGEYILKTIAYFAKQNIVIRYPLVLLGNVMSNFNLSVGRGYSPVRVGQLQLENAKWIREYVDHKKLLDKIIFKQKLGTATSEELSEINWLNNKLNHNPVKVLMDKGMYQAIIEDLNPEEVQNIGPVNKLLNAKLKNVPKWLRTTFRQTYLMEGNPYFDFMFQATQYSDFVARATQYQLDLERAERKTLRGGKDNPYYVQKYDANKQLTPEWINFEKRVTHDVWNAFINYDKPQSSKEQYLNDLGLMMFTKFLKRIQSQIFKGIGKAPISSALFLASQMYLMDTSDIMESQVPLMRGIGYNFPNVLDNLVNATLPVPIQMFAGVGVGG